MPLRAFCLFILLLFSAPRIHASEWEFAGWHGGGCYPNFAFDAKDPMRMYLTSDVAGVWKSEDGGETWKTANKGLGRLYVPVLETSPFDPKIIYAGTREGLYVSTDGAENWKPVGGPARSFTFSRPDSFRAILFSSIDPSTILIGTSKGAIWRSQDGGLSWKKLGVPFGEGALITAMAWADTSEAELWVASKKGIVKLTFSTLKWERPAASPKTVSDIILSKDGQRIYAAGSEELFVSSDRGQGWKSAGRAPRGKWYRLWEGSEGLFGAWNDDWKGGVALSMDQGESWKDLKGKMKPDVLLDPTREWAGPHGRINALKQSPHAPGDWWRVDWWGVWKSSDGGKNWTEKIRGAANTVASDVLVGRDGTLYVATMDNGLLASDDGGGTYRTLFPKSYNDDESGHVWRLLERSDGVLLATSSPWNTDFEQIVTIRPDGSFLKHRKGLPGARSKKNTVWNSGYARAIAADPRDPMTIYLGIDGDDAGGFFISRDGGQEWKRPRGQPGSLKIYNALAVDPVRPGRILWGASGARGGAYLSEDGGESWSYVQKRMKNVFDAVYTADGTAWVSGSAPGPALFMSVDGGRRWKAAKYFGGDGAAEALCALPDGRLVLGITRWNALPRGGIFLSSADRRNWTRIDESLPDGDAAAAITYDPRTQTLYAAMYAGSVYKRRLE